MVFASGMVGAALAVGLAALFGSRGPVIGILIAAHLVFEPQLQGATFLGDARQALPDLGDQPDRRRGERARLTSSRSAPPSPWSLAWIAAALAAGAWRTKTREI